MVGLGKAEKVDKSAKAGPMSTKTAGPLVTGTIPTEPGSTAEEVEKSVAAQDAEPVEEPAAKTLHKPAHPDHPHGKK
jgi:hypothetical protein